MTLIPLDALLARRGGEGHGAEDSGLAGRVPEGGSEVRAWEERINVAWQRADARLYEAMVGVREFLATYKRPVPERFREDAVLSDLDYCLERLEWMRGFLAGVEAKVRRDVAEEKKAKRKVVRDATLPH